MDLLAKRAGYLCSNPQCSRPFAEEVQEHVDQIARSGGTPLNCGAVYFIIVRDVAVETALLNYE